MCTATATATATAPRDALESCTIERICPPSSLALMNNRSSGSTTSMPERSPRYCTLGAFRVGRTGGAAPATGTLRPLVYVQRKLVPTLSGQCKRGAARFRQLLLLVVVVVALQCSWSAHWQVGRHWHLVGPGVCHSNLSCQCWIHWHLLGMQHQHRYHLRATVLHSGCQYRNVTAVRICGLGGSPLDDGAIIVPLQCEPLSVQVCGTRPGRPASG